MSAPRDRGTTLRLVAFAVVLVLVVVGAVGYLWHEHAATERAIARAPVLPTTSLSSVESVPHIVFRSNDRAHYGVLAMVPLADPSGPRALTSTSCERVYAGSDRLVCLSLDRVAVRYRSQVLDADLRPTRTLRLAGIPSRARMTVDGTLAASTAFTAVGDSYASTSFSTRTFISRTAGARQSLSLEDFTLVHHGRSISPVDRNYWGVTFAADDDLFYATAAFGGHTWLVRGDLGTRTMTTLRSDAECPSLSPDGRTLVYKKRLGKPAGHWRLAALDLTSGKETLLAETRIVDDQAEWLDDDHVLYAIQGTRGDPYLSDVYQVPADGTGSPRLLIRRASSPSVVR